jgi:hypothetical protein
MPLQTARLVVEPPERAKFFFASELRAPDRGFQDTDRFVVDLERHGKGMPILPPMRKRKSSGIREAIRRSMHDFSHHRQGPNGSRTHTRRQE